jgi:nucleotide-binding universal stress UspA family protein
MYRHILIATDGSELATKALEHGLALAKHDNAHVTVVTVALLGFWAAPPASSTNGSRFPCTGTRH